MSIIRYSEAYESQAFLVLIEENVRMSTKKYIFFTITYKLGSTVQCVYMKICKTKLYCSRMTLDQWDLWCSQSYLNEVFRVRVVLGYLY